MKMNLENMVLVKPKAYEEMGKEATIEMIKASQRVLTTIKKGIIDRGEEQLKTMTGYNKQNLPDESPKPTPDISLDSISFDLKTTVQVVNPEYVPVFSKIEGFLEDVVDDWKEGVRKNGVRTYEIEVIKNGEKSYEKSPFIRWDYLMSRVLKKISRKTELDAVNEVETIKAPKDLDEMKLEKLVIPITKTKGFDITQPGSAKTWYLAKRFYDEVQQETVQPVKEEMEKRSGVTKEEMPDKTKEYWEKFEDWIYGVTSIPSPRRQQGKVLSLLFTIPQKTKPKGSTALPEVPDHNNYIKLLEEYRPVLPTSLQKWKTQGELNYEGKIGEMVVFYYELENDARVLEQFPYIPEYQLKRDGDKMFISVQALYNRLKALEKDYKTSRLLRKHTVEPLV